MFGLTVPGPVTTAPAAIRLASVSKVYGSGPGAVTALDEVSLGLGRGRFTAIMGRSGSGKSTLLRCAAGSDRPTSGTVWLGDTDLSGLTQPALTRIRLRHIGFLFEADDLLPALTVEQNIALPLAERTVDRTWLRHVAAAVGLADRLGHRPSQLSGGARRRVAIARALITRPAAIVADEPAGALDTRTGRQVLQLLREIVDRTGQTVVMATHDPMSASYADRVVFLADGRLAGSLDEPCPLAIAERMTHLGAW